MDGLEDTVRSALRSGTPEPDVEAFLQRVHHGATRRRRRQRLAGAGALAVAAAVAGLVITTLPLFRPRPAPYASPLQSVQLPPATAGMVLSVSASAPDEWWVLSSVPCRRFKTGCAVVGGTTLDRPVRVPAATSTEFSPTPATVEDVRFAVDGEDGWLFGGALWSTHDGGASWHRVQLPAGTTVQSLAAYGGEVYALTAGRHGRAVMLTAATGSDAWTRHSLPRGIWAGGSHLALARGVEAFAANTRHLRGVVVSHDQGRTWRLTASPCGTAELAATGTSVWATCPADAHGAVYTSPDARHWQLVGRAPLGEGTELAPITEEATLAYLGRQVRRVDPQGVSAVRVGLRRGEQIRYIGFNDSAHGFLVTTAGRLLVSTDAGHTWTQVR